MMTVCIPRKTTNNRDRISELPDEILIKILSELSFREATIATSLALRWARLSLEVPDRLCFDSPELLANLRRSSRSDRAIIAARFVESVERVVRSHPAEKSLDELRVRFEIDRTFSDEIDGWIGAASRKGASNLGLEFPTPWGTQTRRPYRFPSVETLTQTLCPGGFASLVDLTLGFVVLGNENVVQYFLDNCPLLENLCLKKVSGFEEVGSVNEARRLRSLRVLDCPEVETFETISSPNMVRFEYRGQMTGVPFEEVPRLSEMLIGDEQVLALAYYTEDLFVYLSQLTKLRLELSTVDFLLLYANLPSDLPSMSNLLELELEVAAYNTYTLLWLSLLVKSAPSLQRFSIRMDILDTRCPKRKLLKKNPVWRGEEDYLFRHLKLNRIEMIGFRNSSYEIELLKQLIRNSLERKKVIVIDVCNPFLETKPWRAVNATKLNKIRKVAKKLRRDFPANVELVIL